MMKIAVWNECYLSGGADWSLIDLISAWPDPDDSFLVCVNESHEGLELIREKTKGRAEIHVFVSPLEIVNRLSSMSSPRPIRMSAWVFAIACSAVRYSLSAPLRNPDVLLMNNGGFPGGISNYIAALIALVHSVPKRVMIVRNYPRAGYARSRISRLARFACTLAIHRIVAVSDSLKSALATDGRIPARMLTRIYNGVNTGNKAAGPPASPGPKGLDGTVGIIGTLEGRKGHAVLFRAWASVLKQMPHAKLWVVGSRRSGDKAKLLALADELEISESVVWIDFVRNVESVYSSLDLVIMPSLSSESFGRVVVEAMAFGKPVVASCVGGIPELIENGSDGFLFDPVRSEELSSLIVRLLSDPSLRRDVGQRGQLKHRRLFTDRAMAEQYRALLASMSQR